MTMSTSERATGTLTQVVAAEIRAWMGRLGVRQSQLARLLGENEQWLSTRLRGVTPINLNDLQRIADALSLQPIDFFPSDKVRPNNRSTSSPERMMPAPRPAPTRPKSRPSNERTRPVSPTPPSRRRPARIDRAAGR